jgi:hypothetical protein
LPNAGEKTCQYLEYEDQDIGLFDVKAVTSNLEEVINKPRRSCFVIGTV